MSLENSALPPRFDDCAVLVVADYDSFMKAALAALAPLTERGARARIVMAAATTGQLSAGQLAGLGLSEPPDQLDVPAIARLALTGGFDAVLVCLNGKRTRQLYTQLSRQAAGIRQRPVFASFYPGVVFRMHLHGFMDRAPADLLCFNSEHDRALYARAAHSIGGDGDNGVVTGLSIGWRPALAGAGAVPGDAIVYFDQPTVPSDYAQRLFVLDSLLDLARRHPDVPVLLKPRNRPEETSLHKTLHHYEDLLKRRPPPPANFRVVYDPVVALLPRTRLALCFSSSVALEAIRAGVATRILTDVSINETNGVSFFAGCGFMARLSEVTPGMPYVVNADWLETVGGPADGEGRFLSALRMRIDRFRQDPPPMRPLSPYYGSPDWIAFEEAHRGERPRRRWLDAIGKPYLLFAWRTLKRLVRPQRRG